MAQFTRHQVISEIHNSGMVPLFYHYDIEVAKNILKACYDGGVRLLEFTNRGDFAHDVFKALIPVSYTHLTLPTKRIV